MTDNGMTTLDLRLSPIELTLVAASINDKIAWLDSEIARLRALAGLWSIEDAEQSNEIMRLHYAAIVRKIEQLLDVPFIDGPEAMRLLEQGTVIVSVR